MNSEWLVGLVFRMVLVVGLVLLNGFFVAAEFSLVKVREGQLEEFALRSRRSVRWAKQLLKQLDQALSACQLGITLASLALGWIGEPFFSALLAPFWEVFQLQGSKYEQLRESGTVVVGFAIMTLLHITAGEQAPKWLAIQRPLSVSLVVSGPLLLFQSIAYPFTWLLNRASQGLLRTLGVRGRGGTEVSHSEEELRRILVAALDQSRGELSKLLREIMLSTFELKERIARDVMKPRRLIVGFSDNWPIQKCVEVAKKTRFSRFPIFEGGDLDRILGVVHIKDLYYVADRIKSARDLVALARPVLYAPEWARLDLLLSRFLQERLHLCIVVDEYGATSGLVTLEDVLEELVGEIRDEFDLEEQSPIQQLGNNTWRVDGLCPLHEVSELLGTELEDETVSTIGGYIVAKLGFLPQPGDRIKINGWECVVEEVGPGSVKKLLVRRAQSTSGELG